MHTDPSQNGSTPEHLEHHEVAFEKRDLGARAILLFFAVLFIAGAAIHLVVLGLYEAFENVGEAHQPPANPMIPNKPAPVAGVLQNAGNLNLTVFPEPRLQTDEPNDMNRFLWQEGRLMDAKPWRDGTGAIHIPVAQAMQLTAQKGLPVRPGAQQPSASQPPMGQTESGNIAFSESEKASDAVSAVTGSAPGIPSYVPQPTPKQ